MRRIENILVTGGAGFIGSNFIRFIFNKTDFSGTIVNYDKLTYAGNAENLTDIIEAHEGRRHFFVHGDICSKDDLNSVFNKYHIDTVIHFAAESHVDRSIQGPADFIQTNIYGTFTLLECAREAWSGRNDVLFHHVSTDEVYGSLGADGYFIEDTPYNPRSPYSASKASSDHIVKAYFHTYGLPITISNSSNNYGPYQFPEKLIPVVILSIKDGRNIPVYGDGKYIRDWVYVDDHNRAVWAIVNKGRTGETYNVGGENEWENSTLVNVLCEKMAQKLGKDRNHFKSLITHVKDRPGHDRRYAIKCDKLKHELNWKQEFDFSTGLDHTIEWYVANEEWINRIRTGEYRKWMEKKHLFCKD